jgi:hypothetical protein
MINRLLEADAGYFEEHRYLDPFPLGHASKLNIAKDMWKDVCSI